VTRRFVAPAGAPIGGRDLAAWMLALGRRTDYVAELERTVCARVGATACTTFSTGRAGLAVLLRALRRLHPDRGDEVIVPAYTCYTVAASVVVAGLRPRLVDIDPATLDLDPEALEASDTSRVLAVVATNLYGLPGALPRHAAFAARRGIALVDDAAQAFGAEVGGRPSGTWGDAGLYSLDKGKTVSAMEGGVVVTSRDDLASALRDEHAALSAPRTATVAKDAAKLVAYAALLAPSRYWIPNAIPQLKLGTTVYSLDIPLDRYPRVLAAMACVMLPRLDEFNARRRANAARLAAALADVHGVRVPVVTPGAVPVFVRFPLLARDASARAVLIEALLARGIGASGSYPAALCDVPEVREVAAMPPAGCPGARHVAECIVTLPTHPLVEPRDVDLAASTVRDVSALAGAGRPLHAVAH
jgi:perosamine synthetase